MSLTCRSGSGLGSKLEKGERQRLGGMRGKAVERTTQKGSRKGEKSRQKKHLGEVEKVSNVLSSRKKKRKEGVGGHGESGAVARAGAQ